MTDTEWTKEYIEHRDRAVAMYSASRINTPIDRNELQHFKTGFNEGAAHERERAKVLVEALKSIYAAHKRGCVKDKGCECWWLFARQALAKYGEKSE